MVMKNLTILLFAVTIAGCQRNMPTDSLIASNSSFITLDSGNRMIASYLNSINVSENDTDLHSVLIDADALRNYLDIQDNGSSIQYIKIMLAHTPGYMNSGNEGIFAGYRSDALTFVLAGVDSFGDYVFLPGNLVVNRGVQCPSNCPPGTAGNDLLTTATQRK